MQLPPTYYQESILSSANFYIPHHISSNAAVYQSSPPKPQRQISPQKSLKKSPHKTSLKLDPLYQPILRGKRKEVEAYQAPPETVNARTETVMTD
jgi:hypothetical protein